MVRENGTLTVPAGLECVSLAVGAAVTPLAARIYPAHQYRRAVVQTTAPVRWTASPDPDNDPSDTFGMILEDGQTLVYDGDLDNLRFYRVTTDAILTIHYFGLG